MSGHLTSGPGVKPGQARTRRTKVAKHAYWAPLDNGGDGGWRYLPIDTAHNQTIQDVDIDGNPTRPVDLYVSKGYLPVEMIPEEDARRESLPVNWRDVAMRGAEPEFPKKAKAAAGAKGSEGF